MKISKDFLRLCAIPLTLFIGVFLTAAFTIYYTATIRSQTGEIIPGNQASEFTRSFSDCVMGKSPFVTDEGIARLCANDLWLQILDENGAELYSYSKPADAPSFYRPIELIKLYQKGDGHSSVFIGYREDDGKTYTYIIGFPIRVSKIVMVVDRSRYNAGKRLVIATVILTALVILGLTIGYNAVIVKSLKDIREALSAVSSRSYSPGRRGRFLKEVYEGVDLLNQDVLSSDRRRAKDEQAREEWLTNITHDLKTPLSPIRGYAELLSEQNTQPAAQFGAIILKNALYAENLVDDLKLTYQLKSGSLPLKKEEINVTRFTRETVIDLLNAPDYEGRNILFESDCESAVCSFDARLIKRALLNVLVNALKHTNGDAEIGVRINRGDGVKIKVYDNGAGMTPEEIDGLFTRYYRGASTGSNPEGTGLGMAIARQIIDAHGGSIIAQSEPGVGTTIEISLPYEN